MPEPQTALPMPGTPAVRLIPPIPIEDLVVVDGLSGHEGTNRSPGHRQIAADNDRDALPAWLARSVDSPNTLANSRREAERLLLWALVEAGKPLSSLTHEDLLRYQRFLADPQQGNCMSAPAQSPTSQPTRTAPSGRVGPGEPPTCLSSKRPSFSGTSC